MAQFRLAGSWRIAVACSREGMAMSTFSSGSGFTPPWVVARLVMALLASGLVLLRLAADSGSVVVPEGRRLVISSSILVTTPPLPNMLFSRDNTSWIFQGVTLNPMYWPARRQETLVTTAVYRFHPVFADRKFDVWLGDLDAAPPCSRSVGLKR
jgi:hypothetical protein